MNVHPRTTYARAVREYDVEFQRHLVAEIINGIAKAFIVTDPDLKVMALRTGETVEALITCLISFAAMSPHFGVPSHTREFAESLAKRFRREVVKARAQGRARQRFHRGRTAPGRERMTKLSVSCRGFHPLCRNTLRGFCEIQIAELRLTIRDIAIHEKGSARWAQLPAKPQVKDGALVHDSDGKIQYFLLMSFDTRAVSDAFSAAVIRAPLELLQPPSKKRRCDENARPPRHWLI